jgi:hypothetical protein
MAAKHWISLTICVALVGAVALVQHHRHSRATVDKVATAVVRASPRAGHVKVGGRTFRLSEYRVKGRSLRVATAQDTKGLNDGTGTIVRSRGPLQLNYSLPPESGPWRVRFVDAGGHQTVIVADTVVAFDRALANLAVRLAS